MRGDIINDPHVPWKDRIGALAAYDNECHLSRTLPKPGEINNHIHTIYSFSPYTPSMAALKAREAGLEAAGSVDHDSYAAAAEMREACDILRMGCVTGFELRVSFRHTEFADHKINSPDSPGIVYMTVQGIPVVAAEKVKAFLLPLNKERRKRNIQMVAGLNKIISAAGLAGLSYERDIVPLSMEKEGGSVTERHILYALSLVLIKQAGKGSGLVTFLKEKFGLELTGKPSLLLSDEKNPFCAYDLLGVLKSSFNDKIFIQPDDKECLPAEIVTEFARSINAVPCYAYLGDVGESPTGDKKAEKFEDDYLDAVIPRLKDLGFLGVTYMPPRNTPAQLERLQKLCRLNGFIEISGVDINSPRQKFECPEIRRPEFSGLRDTTWALAAHEKLAGLFPERGLFNPSDPLAKKPLRERIEAFAAIGISGNYEKESV
jgi:hypothetical protein